MGKFFDAKNKGIGIDITFFISRKLNDFILGVNYLFPNYLKWIFVKD